MNLIEISPSGAPIEDLGPLPDAAAGIGPAYLALYSALGFERPWIGYFACEHSICIGTCGYKGPPKDKRVEIAYFTFPEYQGRGHATAMARTLIDRAWNIDATLTVAAQTLPEENASTAILRKLGFAQVRRVHDPDVGEVWEWQRDTAASVEATK